MLPISCNSISGLSGQSKEGPVDRFTATMYCVNVSAKFERTKVAGENRVKAQRLENTNSQSSNPMYAYI